MIDLTKGVAVIYKVPGIHEFGIAHVVEDEGWTAQRGGIVWKILLVADLPKRDPLAVLLMALCPTSIMISGFHGNTDPLMIALLLLSVYLIEGDAPSWIAGVAMGLATNVKVVPVVLLPVVLLYLPNSWARAKFLLGAAITFAINITSLRFRGSFFHIHPCFRLRQPLWPVGAF